LTPIESLQMPFHFITGYRAYNFIMGALVRIVGERPSSSNMALGVVDHKQSDGRLRVRRLDDMDTTVLMWPWHVAKMSMVRAAGYGRPSCRQTLGRAHPLDMYTPTAGMGVALTNGVGAHPFAIAAHDMEVSTRVPGYCTCARR